MPVPFSDIPSHSLDQKLESLLKEIGDLEHLLYEIGASESMTMTAQNLLILLGSIQSASNGDQADAKIRIRSVIEQLSSIVE